MSTGILTFDLNEQSDNEYFQIAVKSSDLYLVLYDLDQKLRGYLKYGYDSEKFANIDEAIESIRDSLWDYMFERGLHFDMLS